MMNFFKSKKESQVLWELAVSSTSFIAEPKLNSLSSRKFSINFSYESDDSSLVSEELFFHGVESYKCTFYRACSIEMIEAYDKILNLGDTDWLREIKSNLGDFNPESDSLKHLRVYFDDGPCFEFICLGFESIINR